MAHDDSDSTNLSVPGRCQYFDTPLPGPEYLCKKGVYQSTVWGPYLDNYQ